MAFSAFHDDVFSLQRVSGCVVFLHTEQRRLPSIEVMAFRAFALLRPRVKLAFVRVRFVAVGAVRKGQRLFEVAFQVALCAADHGVLAEQRVLGFGMIKLKLGQDFLPARGGVTVLATLLK